MMDVSVLTWIGVYFTLYYTLKLLYNFYHLAGLYIFKTYPDFSKYGKWSVVTGSVTGLGKAFAMELASKGQNIILMDRDEKGLVEVADYISSHHGVQTKQYKVDFSEDESIYKDIETFLQDYDIGVLVNNVGIAHTPAHFTEIPNLSKQINNSIKINILSALKMIQVVLPGMECRKRGCIINVSSFSAFHEIGKVSLYGASKAYLKHFSQTLSDEYKHKGITVQCCCPYFLKTAMTKFLLVWNTLKTPEEYVSSSLATVGKETITFGNIESVREDFIFNHLPKRFHGSYMYFKLKGLSYLKNQLTKKQD